MSNIREYTKKKEQKNTGTYGQKIIKHRLSVFYRVSLAIILTVALTAILVVQMKNRVFEGYQVISSVSKENISGTTSLHCDGKILTYSKDGAHCSNTKGEVLWNQTYQMQAPMVDTCRNMMTIADYNGSTIYVMSTEKIIGEINTNMPIRSVCVSASGLVAAVLDEADITWIYLYDSSTGKTIAYFKTLMKTNGYPIDVSISDSGALVAVSYLYVDSGAVTSKVAFYNFGQVGQNVVDNLVSGYDYVNHVTPRVQFMDNATAFALADDRLVIYQGEQKPIPIKEILLSQEVQSLYYSENYIGLVYLNVSGDSKYRIEVYHKDGELVQNKNFDIEYTNIEFAKDKMIIYNDAKCLIQNIGGVENFAGDFTEGVQLLLPTSSSYKYILVTEDSIDTIELK